MQYMQRPDPDTVRRPARRARLLLLLPLLALPLMQADAQPSARPCTAADIEWPTPSRPPGTVTFRSRHPTEAAWDPLLTAFRRKHADTFPARLDAARRFAAGRRSTVKLPETPADTGLIRAVDIVRIPPVTDDALELKLSFLRRHLQPLEAEGYPLAVWEIRELPEMEDLAEWTDTCLKAFSSPPILMPGWHISNGAILPRGDRMEAFLRRCAPHCHSIIITGEELNTQFYATEDGGRALPFLTYWIGFLRETAPDAFLWCRIDEMMQRHNDRQVTWMKALLPVTDGLNYQVCHVTGDVEENRNVSEQFTDVQRLLATMAEEGAARPGGTPEDSWPMLLGGYTVGIPVVRHRPDFGREQAHRALSTYHRWLRDERITGCVRYVGMLPDSPAPDLVGRIVVAGQELEPGAPPDR